MQARGDAATLTDRHRHSHRWLANGSAAAIVTCLAGAAHGGAVWYVDHNAPNGRGTSWASAFSNLHQAFAAAEPGDEVRVADGTYRPTEGTDRTVAFEPGIGVTVLGGFAGLGAADPDARDVALYSTILSGAIGTAASTDNSYTVLRIGLGQSDVLFDGVTIRDGYASEFDPPYEKGGGVRISSGSLTLVNCIVRDNGALGGGAGIATSARLTLRDTAFIANTDLPGGATGQNGGGAIYAGTGANLTIDDCTFTDNVSANSPILRGDAITCSLLNTTFSGHVAAIGLNNSAGLIENCTFLGTISPPSGPSLSLEGSFTIRDSDFLGAKGTSTNPGALSFSTPPNGAPSLIENCSFNGNRAALTGGAIRSSGKLLIRNSSFKNNVSESDGQGSQQSGGGAISAHAGSSNSLSIVGCTFEGNAAPLAPGPTMTTAGGAIRSEGPTTIVHSRFLKNSSVQGSAVWLLEAADIIGCEFSGNSTTTIGGTIANKGGILTLQNSTLAGNATTTGLTAGVLAADVGAVTTIANSILWGNTKGGAVTLAAQLAETAPGSPSVNFCTISQLGAATLGGIGNVGVNPKFVLPLGADGIVGTPDDDLRLQATSLAIDSGANELMSLDPLDVDVDGTLFEPLPIDIDGQPRVTDGPAVGANCLGGPGVVDRGAHEFDGRALPPLLGDLEGDGVVDAGDLSVLLGAWGPCPASCCLADLDGDGYVSASDLAILLGNLWGASA